jgi:hypothetical protein
MRARLIVLTVAALLLPASSAAAGDPIMPLSQVRSGMQCTGLLVVRGTEISSFDVEILEVIDGDASGQGPRLHERVSAPPVDGTGVGPGFSGSPIYCRDGRGHQPQRRGDLRVARDYAADVPMIATTRSRRSSGSADGRSGRARRGDRVPRVAHRAIMARAKPLATPLTGPRVQRRDGPRASSAPGAAPAAR